MLDEITHLILISDLRMLCPIWRIFDQLGEFHLNVFWHHILENLLSVDIFYPIGIIFYQMLKDYSGPKLLMAKSKCQRFMHVFTIFGGESRLCQDCFLGQGA